MPDPARTPSITVVITTYNRKDEIGVCLDSVLKQDYPCEILVLDDAGSDGTTEYLREHYPTVRVERSEENIGLIGQRDRAADLATGEVMVSIDDDIALMGDDTLSRIAAVFDAPDIAAVTFPSIDVRKDDRVQTRPPSDEVRYASAEYRGGVVALRRDVFRACGGYDARLIRQNEEMDLALRIYRDGYVIAMADTTPVHHYESPRRVRALTYYYGARNVTLFCWWRLPLRSLPAYWCARTLNLLKAGFKAGFPLTTLRGLVAGNWFALTRIGSRKPASPRTFAVYEWLRKSGPQPIDEVRRRLAAN